MRSGDDRDRAARIEAQLHALVEHAAELDIGRDRPPAQLAVLAARCAPGVKVLPMRKREALVHHALELTAVVVVMGGRVIGQRRRLDEVAAAQFDPIDARHLGRAIDQPLDQIDRFRPTGAAIDRGRRGIGEDRLRAERDRLHVIDARDQHQREEQRRGDGRPPIGAQRLAGPGAQRQDRPLGIEGELAVDHLVARLGIEDERLAAGRRPCHWPAEAARRPQHQHVIRIDVRFHAEAAADIGRDHANLRFWDVQHRGRKLAAQPVRVLRGAVERIAIAAEVPNGAARLDRIGSDAIVLEPQRDDVLGLGEGGVGRRRVAERDGDGAVAVRAVVPDLRRARFERVLHADHRRQRLVVDDHALGGVARLCLGLRHHERDTVADAAHAIREQHRPHGAETLGAAPVFRHEMRRDAADSVRDRIGAGQHQQHAPRRPRRRDIDVPDRGMGVRRQHRDAVALPRQLHVADIGAAAGEKALVLHPPHGLADAESSHRSLPAAGALRR